jgi:hypothetical protein
VFRTDLCLNPILHSKMDFKQQKIVILCRFMSLDSGEKIYFVEQLDNVLEKSISNLYHYNLQYTQLYKVRTVKPQGVQILFVCDAGASPTRQASQRGSGIGQLDKASTNFENTLELLRDH